jgi:hypothetical protein
MGNNPVPRMLQDIVRKFGTKNKHVWLMLMMYKEFPLADFGKFEKRKIKGNVLTVEVSIGSIMFKFKGTEVEGIVVLHNYSNSKIYFLKYIVRDDLL